MHDLNKLKAAISNPKKLSALSEMTGLSIEYLKILKREISALEPTPVRLKELGILSNSLLDEINSAGIGTTRDFLEQNPNIPSLDCGTYRLLFSLSDLVRINGVGPLAARAFVAAGYSSVIDIANAEAEDMLDRIATSNVEHKYYNVNLGIRDMQYCIDNAKLLRRFSQ